MRISHQSADVAGLAHSDECKYANLSWRVCVVIHITPAANFGDAFARGWKSLPDELKLKILGHVLPSGEDIEKPHLDVDSCTFGPDRFTLIGKPYYLSPHSELLRCLAMGPDNAPLTHQHYYTKNTFIFRRGLRLGSGLEFPNVKVRGIIRSLEVRMGLIGGGIPILRKLANGVFGFDDIKKMLIVIYPEGTKPRKNLQPFSSEAVFTFACKGRITCDPKYMSKIGMTQDEFEQLISPAFRFTG